MMQQLQIGNDFERQLSFKHRSRPTFVDTFDGHRVIFTISMLIHSDFVQHFVLH